MIAMREKRVGPYTVRELSMRETMRLLKQYPEDHPDRGAALLGAAVFNGAEAPLGLDVLDLGTGMYQALMEAHQEVTGKLTFEQDQQGNA
jgi:hypothetical protein